MPRPFQRMPLELGLDLCINQLLREGFLIPGEKSAPQSCHWLDLDGDVTANAVIAADMTIGKPVRYGEMRILADWIDQTIQMTARRRHFGGQQWYFMCPCESRYVSVLWSPPGQKFFAGRKSWPNVAYLSQFYTAGGRAHRMANKLCDRIGGPGASEEWDVPPKPKWMRWRTYERLSERCEAYRKRADILSREYQYVGGVVSQ